MKGSQTFRQGIRICLTGAITLFLSCRSAPGEADGHQDENREGTAREQEAPSAAPEENPAARRTPEAPGAGQDAPPLESLPDTAFVRLADYSDGFSFDLRYATNNNFMNEAVYPCGECYTRVKTARALLAANRDFERQGFRIRFFDCYRPNSVQYKMWELVPNPQYVANPEKGSIHNRGGAVDITLETLDGEPLEMGTDFDFFGPRAHHDHTDFTPKVLENRRILKETMESNGFWSIRTEWWHYNLSAASSDPVADFRWPCDTD